MTGVELIAKERFEQIAKHGRTVSDDVETNNQYQLADAANRLLCKWPEGREDLDNAAGLDDNFRRLAPDGWDKDVWQKMFDKPYKERLVIAGALIAAELDRLNNQHLAFSTKTPTVY